MKHAVFGPGFGCHECGEVYGQHKPFCTVTKRMKMRAAELNIEASRRLRDAMESSNPEEPAKTMRDLRDEGLMP